jgi:hypothetical protein
MPFVWTGAEQPILEKRRRECAESRIAELHFNPNPPMPSGGGRAIQVGAFKDPGLARAGAEGARAQALDQLRSAILAVQPTAPFGNTVLYRARLANLSAGAAASACTLLNQRQLTFRRRPPGRHLRRNVAGDLPRAVSRDCPDGALGQWVRWGAGAENTPAGVVDDLVGRTGEATHAIGLQGDPASSIIFYRNAARTAANSPPDLYITALDEDAAPGIGLHNAAIE